MNWPWDELGLPGPVGLSLIRQAYAERLKRTRPEEKPEEFQRLHNAYQAACRIARRGGADGASGDESGTVERSELEEASREREPGAAPRAGQREEKAAPKEWDFVRLFAEEAAEKRGKRFLKLRELRQKNRFRYEAWRPPPSDDPAEAALNWIAVSRALAFVEELTFSGADVPLWNLFCKSELFQYVRNNPDFVFALEDFLRECPEIPETGRAVLRRAYGLDTPPIRREYKELYPLLGGGTEGSFAFGEDGKPERETFGISSNGRLLALAALILLVTLMNCCANFLVTAEVREEQVRVWMEEDFGREFIRASNGNLTKTFPMLDTRAGIYFNARWDGPRNRERGRRGYATDYTEARMTEELAAFAERWDWSVSPRRNHENAALSEGHMIYLSMPLTGAEEGISELGSLLSAIGRNAWYQELPPECALYLCWEDWSFYEHDLTAGDFDASAIRWYYERFFGPDLCRIALEETSVAASDMGAPHMLFPEGGVMTLGNRRFFHVAGTGTPPGKALFHYFLSENGAELFCVPAGGRFSELTMERLYQMDEQEYEVKGFPEKLRVFRETPE
ncbi:MAG: hypothetical protein IJQ81_01835 [Oscillibacter sp.]|nr:hypothetical protein [Oscillibacter sp.]